MDDTDGTVGTSIGGPSGKPTDDAGDVEMETLTVRYTPPSSPSSLDPANQPAYEARLRKGLRDALDDAGRDKPGDPIVIRVQTAVTELVRLMAFAAHNAPTMQVPSRRRQWCDGFSRALRKEIEAVQRAAAAGELADAEGAEFIHINDQALEWAR